MEFQDIGITCDAQIIELGAIVHDAGKIKHPEEFSEPGALHESAGEQLLLSNGVQKEIARCCASHGANSLSSMSLEEQTVALADKLWKGKRVAELELSVIDQIAARKNCSRWDIFEHLDTAFEKIAAGGAGRIQQTTPK